MTAMRVAAGFCGKTAKSQKFRKGLTCAQRAVTAFTQRHGNVPWSHGKPAW